MDNMSAGQELLRQKEERLKLMENALLGGLVSNLSARSPSAGEWGGRGIRRLVCLFDRSLNVVITGSRL